MNEREKLPEGFGNAEAEQILIKAGLKDSIDVSVIPKVWIVGGVLFDLVCGYYASIDVLLVLWGKDSVGTLVQANHYNMKRPACCVDYTFEVEGKTYYSNLCYPGKWSCRAPKNRITVEYVSWNPAINKGFHDAYFR